MDKISTQGLVLSAYKCILFYIGICHCGPCEVLRYSVPAVKSLLKDDLFFPKENVGRAVKF